MHDNVPGICRNGSFWSTEFAVLSGPVEPGRENVFRLAAIPLSVGPVPEEVICP